MGTRATVTAAFWLMTLALAAGSKGRLTITHHSQHPSAAVPAVTQHTQHQSAAAPAVKATQAGPASRAAALAKHDKWIVVTTINYPTDTIRKLAAAPGWKVVVVADLKTPKDWALDNVDLISVEDQKSLHYKILPLLPNNHYGRKNIGYLWAIEHGAKTVYETDDDNILKVEEPASMQGMEFYVYNSTGTPHVCNPYEFFGLPNIWPRGYPLDQIKAPECNDFARQAVRPLILQGLADVDPDVDAIYRLTQDLGVSFAAGTASVALPEGVMCPWNSQNTLFERDALWGLLIPVTTTFRVCDIWRSYWVQRLLWEVEGNLAFGPATVDQHRNAHTLLRDFGEELDLYSQAGDLMKLLTEWRPAAGADLPKMMVDLAGAMAAAKMWAQGDVDLMAAWVADLRMVGYTFPAARGMSSLAAPASFGSSSGGGARGLQPLQQQRASDAPKLAVPRTPRAWRRFRDIILVVVFNVEFPGLAEVQRQLSEAYAPLFGGVVWTGLKTRPAALPASERFVACDGADGWLQHACFGNVMGEVPAPPNGGYLFIGDDTLISPCQMQHFNASKVWFQRAVVPRRENLGKWVDAFEKETNASHWHYLPWNIEAVEAIMKGFSSGPASNKFGDQVIAKIGADVTQAHFGGDYTDGLYVPARLAADFQLALLPFRWRGIFHEIAVPAVLGLITDGADDFEVFKPLYYWDGGRDALMQNPHKVLTPGGGLAGAAFMLHPYKMSTAGSKAAFWAWWQAIDCSADAAAPPKDWPGTMGMGALPLTDTLANGGHPYANLYV